MTAKQDDGQATVGTTKQGAWAYYVRVHLQNDLPLATTPQTFFFLILLIMKQRLNSKYYLLVVFLIGLGCEREFEPEIKGWQAYTLPGRAMVHFDLDGRESTVTLPADEGTIYRFPQWTKNEDHLLIAQINQANGCRNFQLVSVDTRGSIIDTIFSPPPFTAINFKLAPNDSLLLIKSYHDNCQDHTDKYYYTFYNRFTKKPLSDTITVQNARGILFPETIWSPDSRKVILTRWSGPVIKGFVYDLEQKDTTLIDIGTNFVWSPNNQDVVAYIKDHMIYSRNLKTRETELVYEGKRKNMVTSFRWSPDGEFLMIRLRGYLLNVEAPMLQKQTTVYYSLQEKIQSRDFHIDDRAATWKLKSKK